MKDVIVIGGPNGAGKTTWAYRRLSPTLNISEFVNADEIARGISPLDPEAGAIAAGRLMLGRLNELIESEANFAFETTCSGSWTRHVLEEMPGHRLSNNADISLAAFGRHGVGTRCAPCQPGRASHSEGRRHSKVFRWHSEHAGHLCPAFRLGICP